MRWFEAPGLTGESYYRTKRSELRAVLTVVLGLFAALTAGAIGVFRFVGIPSLGPALGMSDFMVEVIKWAIIGAVSGAVLAWPVGAAWERWHRARRTHLPDA